MRRVFLLIVSIILLTTCTTQKPEHAEPTSAIEFVRSHTAGLVSSHGIIKVNLANPPETKPERGTRFSFNPSIRGEEYWIDDHTIAFRPFSPLRPGTNYTVTFALGDVADTPQHLKTVSFAFQTLKQDLEVRIDDISLSGDSGYTIKGFVMTADVSSGEQVKQTLRATIDGRQAPIYWPDDSNRTEHPFEIPNIDRSSFDMILKILWDGTAIGAQATGKHEIPVPAINRFTLLDHRMQYGENPHLELVFSDLLDARQRLTGLIRVGQSDQLNTIIQRNTIRVFYPTDETGTQKVIVERGIRNAAGQSLESQSELEVRFRQIQPELRISGRGVILPTSGPMLIPFESIGLGAVDVHVERIYESNIIQFLQVNDLAGNQEMHRVGSRVANTTFPLTTLGTFNPNRWSSFALDLKKIMETEPGAIYRVILGFRPHHRAIECPDDEQVTSFAGLGAEDWLLDAEEEQEWWNNYSSFWWYPDHNWTERENPCDVSYYTRERWVSRNLLGSDLGIIAKGSDTNEMQIFVTDLATTTSKSNVDLTFYDLRKQVLKQAKTDRNGAAKVQLPEQPFLVEANDGATKGYLRLGNERALSLSTFDVSGTEIKQGLNGFLYGERGVWRPGDSLFVTLIIEDASNQFPEGHPVQFELRNPQGQLMERRVQTQGVNGFYTFKSKTEPAAPTGNWLLTAGAGGVSFTKPIRIETVRPNRLDTQLKLEQDIITSPNRELSGNLTSQWLHGAPASQLKTDISLTLSGSPIRFSNYREFVFNDLTRSFSSQTETIFEGMLDESGTTEFRYTLPALSEAPGRITGRLSTRVFEKSGNFSTHRSSFDYLSYQHYVGLSLPEPDPETGGLDPDDNHEIRVVTLDADGNPVSRTGLIVTVYEMGWRWWWQQPTEGSGMYISTGSLEPIMSTQVQTGKNGHGNASISVGDQFGRVLIRVEDPEYGHAASDLAYVGYSWRQDDSAGEGPARLAIRSDKETYTTGERASVTFPSSDGGRALISLETGSEILESFWVKTKSGETSVNIPIKENMSPNVYAHVMMLQPHSEMANDLPIRMHGVLPLMVEHPGTRLSPELAVPAEAKPNEPMTVRIEETQGKAMTYTLAVVDEGLLNLTNFRTPNPHAHFYARQALGIKTWDMFDHVAGPFTGSMSRVLAVGGDREMQAINPEQNMTRFKPVVHFAGPFELSAGAENTHTIDIPNYVGSVRVMIVAGQDGAYGNASERVTVRQNLMLLASMPRVLGPGERVTLPLTVFTGSNTSGEAEINVSTSTEIQVQESATQRLRLGENDQQLAYFTLETKDTTGWATIIAQARLGSESASDTVRIEIRNPNPPVTRIYQQMVEPGDSWEFLPELPGIAETNEISFEISAIAPVDLERRIGQLINYPHGCLEQIVSSVFPQLYLSAFQNLDRERTEQVSKHITETIDKLRSYQLPSGSLSYWPGRSGVNEWSNIYAFHFLVEAERKGYDVPGHLKNNLRQNLSAASLRFRTGDDERGNTIQAYRLYALSLAGNPEMGAMNRLRNSESLTPAARWRLSAAYQLAGQPEAAVDVALRASRQVRSYREFGYTFGSTLRDEAMILEALSLMDRRMEGVQLAERISEQLSGPNWLSTQETAFSLIAMARYLERLDISDTLESSITYGTEAIQISSSQPINSLRLDPQQNAGLRLKNTGEGVVYARLISTGIPLEGDTEPSSNGLDIEVVYLNVEGEPIYPEQLQQGTDVVIETRITHPGTSGTYNEMALTQIMPSGWEIHNTRMDETEFDVPGSSFSYKDIRDDRVLTYFSLRPGETNIYRVRVNAAFTGTFYLPSFRAYAMYDESVYASTGGKTVEVISGF